MCEQSYSVESVLQKMQTSLACTICLDLLNNPLTTKCGHTFCKDCLDRLHVGSKSSFPCPLCIAPITKRSLTQNAKITSLVTAVRNVIASIKQDCGFQEPKRNIPCNSEIEPEKEGLEDDVPIRRTTRKNKPVSYFPEEVLPPVVNKRKLIKKNKKQEEQIIPGNLILPATEDFEHPVEKELVNVINAGTSGIAKLPLQSKKTKPPLSKVEQWLSKNESINFGKEAEPSDEDLLPTQIFKENLENMRYNSVCNMEEGLSKETNHVNNMWTSQTSTIIFKDNADKILQQNVESKSVEENFDKKIAEEETSSTMSEKENVKNITLISQENETRRGSKRILFEPNNIDVKKINKKNSNHILINEDKNFKNKKLGIPEQFQDFSIPNNRDEMVKSVDTSNITDKEKSKIESDSVNNDYQPHPNRKGHNIRFANSIKLKATETAKPTKSLMLKGKTKKSPGWSRIEGARKDLRSKHTILNILGGEQKMNLDSSRLEPSKLTVESSQESVVVIEELDSQINLESNSLDKGQNIFQKPYIKASSYLQPKNKSFKTKPTVTNKLLKGSINSLDLKSGIAKNESNKDILNSEIEVKNDSIQNSLLQLDCSNKVDTLDKDTNSLTTHKFVDKNVPLFENIEENLNKTSNKIISNEKVCNDYDSVIQKATIDANIKRQLGRSRLSRKTTTKNFVVEHSNVTVRDEIFKPDDKGSEFVNVNDCNKNDSLENKVKGRRLYSDALKVVMKENVSINEQKIIDEDNQQKIINEADQQNIVNKMDQQNIINKTDQQNIIMEANKQQIIEEVNEPKITKDADEQVISGGEAKNKSVTFHSRGTLEEERNFPNSSCRHSIPCELFQVLVKYSQIFSKESQKCPCPNYNQTSESPIQMAETRVPVKIIKDQCTSTSTASVVPDSCTSDYVQEVAIILPDSVPGTSLIFKENYSRIITPPKIEEVTSKEFVGFNSKDDGKSADSSIYEDALAGSQSSQLSASLLLSNKSYSIHNGYNDKTVIDSEIQFTEEPKQKVELKSNMNVSFTENSKNSRRSSTSMRNSTKYNFESKNLEVQEPVSLISEVSSEQHSKKSTESPISFKRGRRSQRICSSSSSSEEDLPDIMKPQKKARIQTQDSILPQKQSPKIDSEEMRDFERYDENVWNYYNKLNKKENESAVTNESKIQDKNQSIVVNQIDDTSDDDLIPGTEEVIKNVEADLAIIKERREIEKVKAESFMDCQSQDGTVDLFSQESVVTTSTTCGMNSSVKELFNKCNKSLNLAHKVLNESQVFSQDFEKLNTSFNANIKPNEDYKDASAVPIRDEDDTANDSHFSVFATESPVLSTQQKNKVQSEVESLRNKILALEAEMNEKKATLNESKIEPKVNETLKIASVPTAANFEGDKMEDFDDRESDLDSEELFKSVPMETIGQKGVTLRNGRSLGSFNKTFKKKMPITLICTGLTPAEVSKVHAFSSTLCGADSKVLNSWSEEVTHVIVKTDHEGMTERTLKYLLGVANGTWVVSVAWISDSLTSRILLPEDEYEALDCTGAPGPSRGRRVSNPIFTGFQFCLVPPFEDVSIDQLQDLIKICRGSVVKSFNEKLSGPKLYVMNSEDPEKEKSNISNCKKRNKVTVGHDWIIECIGMYSLVSLLNYMVGTPSLAEVNASGIPASLIHETQEII